MDCYANNKMKWLFILPFELLIGFSDFLNLSSDTWCALFDYFHDRLNNISRFGYLNALETSAAILYESVLLDENNEADYSAFIYLN